MNAQLRLTVSDHHQPVALDFRRLPALAKQQIDHARLPANYEAAKKALALCARVDECKDIADKHSAIAHYAKQIKDNTLLYHAQRVYTRALARIGELLAELPTKKERMEVAKENGVGGPTALRAWEASHLKPKFRERLIEKDPPATIGELARQGQALIPVDTSHLGRYGPQYAVYRKSKYGVWDEQITAHKRAKYILDYTEEAIGWSKKNDLEMAGLFAVKVSQELEKDPGEIAVLKARADSCSEWFDEFSRCLK